jgi:hypothetical protein
MRSRKTSGLVALPVGSSGSTEGVPLENQGVPLWGSPEGFPCIFQGEPLGGDLLIFREGSLMVRS